MTDALQQREAERQQMEQRFRRRFREFSNRHGGHVPRREYPGCQCRGLRDVGLQRR